MSALHRKAESFEERDLFFRVLLGAVSATRRMEALLARVAAKSPPERGALPPERNDTLLFGLLGVVSFHRRMKLALEGVDAVRGAAVSGATPDSGAPWPGDMLR